MQDYPVPPNNRRIGFHYFPDTQHYRQEDLDTWLPHLEALGAQWLTLLAPQDRAVPELFLRGLLDAGIEPILHFTPSLAKPPTTDDIKLLVESYARWGVHYVCLFDQPNCHEQWNRGSWAQIDLVERFLDIYLPLAEEVVDAGLNLVFPPLKPGGDYWDTAFLRAALSSIEKRGHPQVLEKLVLGAYASSNKHPLEWGAGGPERWPGAQPYYTPEEEQDQRGFYIFDWYSTITEAALGHKLPILLFKAGNTLTKPEAAEEHNQQNLQIIELLAESGQPQNPVPDNVIGANFWLLSAPAGTRRQPNRPGIKKMAKPCLLWKQSWDGMQKLHHNLNQWNQKQMKLRKSTRHFLRYLTMSQLTLSTVTLSTNSNIIYYCPPLNGALQIGTWT